MGTLRFAAVILLASAASTTSGQIISPGGSYRYAYPYYSWRASTAGEGYARGYADIIRARGEYNYYTGLGAVNWAEARRREIDNSKLWVQTWFELRAINQEHRYATFRQQRVAPETYRRILESRRPKPLSSQDVNVATGQLRWPLLLAFDDYQPHRERIEKAFGNRAYQGAMSVDDYLNVSNAIEIMLARLQSSIAAVPPQEYVTAKRFLERVAVDARSTVSSAVAERPAAQADTAPKTQIR